MLKNDPPPGTRVRIMKDSRRATLVRPLRKYVYDRPDDQFTIELPDGRKLTVRRDEIEEEADTHA